MTTAIKKIIFSAALMSSLHTAQAQVLISLIFGDKLNSDKIEFGLDGGFSSTTLAGATGANRKNGFNLGFYFDIKTKNPSWKWSTGVLVKAPMGAKGLPVYSLNDPNLDAAFAGGSVTTQLGYFYVPVTMKYTLKNNLFFRGGIQLGLLNQAQDLFTNEVEAKEDLTYKLKRKGDFHPIDGGLTAGMGYRLLKGNGMNLGVNYYHGLLDASVSDAMPDIFNRYWNFNIGIPIGKGKAAKKQHAVQEQQ